MQTITVDQIGACLHKLPPEKLSVVFDFVSYLLDREMAPLSVLADARARATLLASEAVLRRDWERPEEDAAWAHL